MLPQAHAPRTHPGTASPPPPLGGTSIAAASAGASRRPMAAVRGRSESSSAGATGDCQAAPLLVSHQQQPPHPWAAPAVSHGQRRGCACVAAAAGGGGGRAGPQRGDGRSSSSWQDRLYGGSSADADNSGSNSAGRSSRGRGRGGGRGRGRAPQQQQQGQAGLDPDSSTTPGGSSRRSSSSNPSEDFVVIRKASSAELGAYIQTTRQLQVQEEELDGGRFWQAALDTEDGFEDEDEFEEGDDDEASGEGGDEDAVGMDELVSLLQELAADLEDEEDEEPAGAAAAAAHGDQAGAAADGQQQQAKFARAWRQAYLGSALPPLTLGHVAVKSTAGRGRGLFTTAAVSAGDVLLVAAPLTLLYSEEGRTPENEELAAHLAAIAAAPPAAAGSSGGSSSSSGGSGGLAPWQRSALLQLRGPGAADGQQQQQLPDLRQLLGPPDEAAWVQGERRQPSRQQQPQAEAQLPGPEELTRIVFANCTGEEFEDQALVLLRGNTSCGHLGVWPAAALINHSCAPNCHSMLVGERLVVRAGKDIAAGAELSLSYLGPQLFAPAAERQAELQQQWGFDCGCSRCKAEARYAPGTPSSSTASASLAQLLQQAYSACQALAPELDAAIEADDTGAIRRLQQQLAEQQQAVEAGVRAAAPPANVRRWLQACVYDLYDLISLAADQLPQQPTRPARSNGGRGGGGKRGAAAAAAVPVDTEALAACTRIVADLTPGSSAHVELATEFMVRTEARFSSEHQEAADALRLCAAAITARYAPISGGMTQLLMDTLAGAALL